MRGFTTTAKFAAVKFILQWVLLGLAIALLVVWLKPAWLRLSPTPTSTPGINQGFADAVARTAPAVVNIFTTRVVAEPTADHSANPRQSMETGLGSGVIVDAAGHVITNNHVIACAQQINVQLADGRVQVAQVVGTDPATDISVLKIDMANLPVAPMGSSDGLRAGDLALAIGTPYGLSQTVTQGIVSATGRGQLGVTAIESFIQTDAAINQGNSGGALINSHGDVIGINTAALSTQISGVNGISFAIPVNLVRGVLRDILQHGRVIRGWFGVETRGLSAEQANALGLVAPEGLVVVRVYADSPAARAGVQVGDVITRINGEQRSLTGALSLVAGTAPGEQVAFSIVRGNQLYDLLATVTEREPQSDLRNTCAAG